jgi:hypothetical protein
MVYTIAAFACVALILIVRGGWQRSWAGKGGRARSLATSATQSTP